MCHTCPCKGEAEGHLTRERKREDATWGQPQAKERWWLPEAGAGPVQILPWDFWRAQPCARLSVSHVKHALDSDFEDCKIINFCGFRPPNLW